MRTNTEVDKNTVEFVRLGFHDVSLDFTAPIRNRATFIAATAHADGYNRFNAKKVAPSFGDELWNDVSTVEFGRAASVVMWMSLPFFPHQANGGTGGSSEKFAPEERQELAQRVLDWARRMQADEFTVYQFGEGSENDAPAQWRTGDHPHRIRVWWD